MQPRARSIKTRQVNWGMVRIVQVLKMQQIYIFLVSFKPEWVSMRDLKVISWTLNLYYRKKLQEETWSCRTIQCFHLLSVLWAKKMENFLGAHGVFFYMFLCCSHSSQILSLPLLKNTEKTHKKKTLRNCMQKILLDHVGSQQWFIGLFFWSTLSSQALSETEKEGGKLLKIGTCWSFNRYCTTEVREVEGQPSPPSPAALSFFLWGGEVYSCQAQCRKYN